jgi:hypothetical protein
MTDREDIQTTADEDRRAEAAVLRWLLALHPAQIAFEELLRAVCDEPEDFAQRDAIERAVRDLATSGLLHRNGELVVPTQAALRFDQLERV